MPTTDATADLAALEWLLAADDPIIPALARHHLAGDGASLAEAFAMSPTVQTLLAGQQPDGGFGVRPYRKWSGAHWRLVALVELGAPPGQPEAVAAAQTVLDWLTSSRHLDTVKTIDGLTRRCASQEGNALIVSARLGLADDPRAEQLARNLVQWQWPDGGWNCDEHASGQRSSFHESLIPMTGLFEYGAATDSAWAQAAAHRTAELLLDHQLFRAHGTGRIIDPLWTRLRFPAYWHYGILPALTALGTMGHLADPRAAEAIELVRSKRRPDGRWNAEGRWGRSDIVDWGRGSGPNPWVTLQAMRVLTMADAANAG